MRSTQKAIVRNASGAITGLLDVQTYFDSTLLASVENNAKKQSEADSKALEEENEKKLKEASELAEKTAQANYYAMWRFAFSCDSVIVDWLSEGSSVSTGEKNVAMEAKAKAVSSKGGTCESLLSEYPKVKERYEALFGAFE